MNDLIHRPGYERYCRGELDDPYPLFDLLRERDPIHWCDRMQMWLVTGYDDVFAGLRDEQRLSSSRQGMYTDVLSEENRQRIGPLVAHLNKWMLSVDGAEHARYRKLVNLAFTPPMIKQLEPEIDRAIDELLNRLKAATQPFDFVEQFCFPLPAYVICRMLGMPREKSQFLHQHSRALADFSGAAGPSLNKHVDRASAGLGEMTAYFDELIEQRRRAPGDDLISAMLAADDQGDRLTNDELFAMCVFLYIAGHSTTAGVIANAAHLLMHHPEQFEKLQLDLDRYAESTIEEVLRYESPVPRAVRRATRDFDWHGRQIKRGQTITLVIGAANRDPRQFRLPEVFDIERSPNRHLSFGFGRHFCLGAPLARLEAVKVLKRASSWLATMTITEPPRWVTRHGLRSLAHLPMKKDRSSVPSRGTTR